MILNILIISHFKLSHMTDFKILEYGDNVEEYVSIYDKPRKIGRPKLQMTVEEKRLHRNALRMKYYHNNPEIENERKKNIGKE